MSPTDELPEDLEQLVLEVLEGPDDRRQAALDALLAQHPQHAASIRRRLLRAERIRTELHLSVPPQEHVEQRIGPFRVLRCLGEGGMGTVWLAEQEGPLRRQVAVKVIKLGMDTRAVLARFETERRTLAAMSHRGIARVLEAGSTERGRPYFAMEWVRGEPITGYCDRHRLDLHRRIALFAEVCDAVQYAHAKGVIHRDLKPSNILVGDEEGRPQPKVIDFGLARAVHRDDGAEDTLTQAGAVLGTLEYMSPEQLAGSAHDVDTRSDVLSLGVVLYELLSGALPRGRDDLRSRVRDRSQVNDLDSPRPSTRVQAAGDDRAEAARCRGLSDAPQLALRLRGDLDRIVMKALAGERERRYQSPRELADDLGRFVRDEPVLAVPPSLDYRLRKFVRRYRIQVASSAAIVVALLVGLLTSTLLYLDAREARRREAARAEEAQRVADVLVSLFEHASPEHSLGEQVPVGLVLAQADRIVRDELADQPGVRGQLLASLGRVHLWLGSYTKAEQQLREAIDAGRSDVEPLYCRALAALQRSDQAEIRLQVLLQRERAADRPNQALLGDALGVLGAIRNDEDRFAEAEQCLQEALTCLGPGADHAEAQGMLGVVQHNAGAHADACRSFAAAVAELDELHPDGHPGLVLKLARSVRPLVACGRMDEAHRVIARALREAERMFGPDHPMTAITLHHEAFLHQAEGRCAEQEHRLRRAIAIYRATMPDDARLPWLLNDLGVLLVSRSRHAEAIQALGEAVTVSRGSEDAQRRLPLYLRNLADAHASVGHCAEAEPLAREALTMLLADARCHPGEVADAKRLLAWVLANSGRLDDAESLAREAVDVLAGDSARAWQEGLAHLCLGFVALMRRQGAEAEPAAQRAHDRLTAVRPEGSGFAAMALFNLGWARQLQDDPAGAEEHYRHSIAMLRAVAPEQEVSIIYPLGNLAMLLRQDHPDEASELLAEAIAVRRARGATTAALARLLLELAGMQLAAGRLADAERSLREVHDAGKAVDVSTARAAAEQLAELFERQGQPERAQALREGHDGGR